MFANMTSSLDFHSKALVLRAERQRVIASNIANADTPGYVARDFDFKKAMSEANSSALRPNPPSDSGHPRHLPVSSKLSEISDGRKLGYATASQPSMDSNSVDMDRERATFVDNSIRYESTLRFINGSAKTLLSAIQGQ